MQIFKDWKSLIKLCVRPGHGTSSGDWNIWPLENGGKWSIIDGLAPTVCVSAEKIEAHGTSPGDWNIWPLENGGKWSIIDALAPTLCVSAEKIEAS
jgi:hypothetical protein